MCISSFCKAKTKSIWTVIQVTQRGEREQTVITHSAPLDDLLFSINRLIHPENQRRENLRIRCFLFLGLKTSTYCIRQTPCEQSDMAGCTISSRNRLPWATSGTAPSFHCPHTNGEVFLNSGVVASHRAREAYGRGR